MTSLHHCRIDDVTIWMTSHITKPSYNDDFASTVLNYSLKAGPTVEGYDALVIVKVVGDGVGLFTKPFHLLSGKSPGAATSLHELGFRLRRKQRRASQDGVAEEGTSHQ